jgi:hypothetical protein
MRDVKEYNMKKLLTTVAFIVAAAPAVATTTATGQWTGPGPSAPEPSCTFSSITPGKMNFIKDYQDASLGRIDLFTTYLDDGYGANVVMQVTDISRIQVRPDTLDGSHYIKETGTDNMLPIIGNLYSIQHTADSILVNNDPENTNFYSIDYYDDPHWPAGFTTGFDIALNAYDSESADITFSIEGVSIVNDDVDGEFVGSDLVAETNYTVSHNITCVQ